MSMVSVHMRSDLRGDVREVRHLSFSRRLVESLSSFKTMPYPLSDSHVDEDVQAVVTHHFLMMVTGNRSDNVTNISCSDTH